MDTQVNVLVISQFTTVRDQLRAAIRGDEDLRLLAMASDPSDGAEVLKSLCPDVVVLQVDDGAPLHRTSPILQATAASATRVLLCGWQLSATQALRTTTLGCWGFMDLHAPSRMMVKAIRSVSRGELWMARRTLSEAFLEASRLHGAPEDMSAALTDREKELVGWIAQGWTNKEIAKHLGISDSTVKTHVHRILKKLHVRSRVHLATHVAETNDSSSTPAGSLLPH